MMFSTISLGIKWSGGKLNIFNRLARRSAIIVDLAKTLNLLVFPLHLPRTTREVENVCLSMS
jgi:hypothetical protein